MSARKKAPAPIPVIGQSAGGDSEREEQLRKWETDRARAREQQASAVTSAPVAQEPVQPAAVPVSEATVSARVAAAGYLEMPTFSEPNTSDPAERLDFYSRGIFAVQYAAKSNHERAEQQRLIGLGLRLKAIKEEELHKHTGFETFGDLTDARFSIKKHQANNIIRVLGVAMALEDITTQELKERPLRVLVPVLDTHGTTAVRETWVEAARHGNVTDTALKEAANFLGYAPPKEQPVLEAAEPKDRPAVPTAAASESARVIERLRALAKEDPVRARREAEDVRRAVEQLVEELGAPAQ